MKYAREYVAGNLQTVLKQESICPPAGLHLGSAGRMHLFGSQTSHDIFKEAASNVAAWAGLAASGLYRAVMEGWRAECYGRNVSRGPAGEDKLSTSQ